MSQKILKEKELGLKELGSEIFYARRGSWGPSWSATFSIFDVWIRSEDIRDQSRKLSEIAKKFGRFFCPPKF